jgi:predicted small lipoprotein YifL
MKTMAMIGLIVTLFAITGCGHRGPLYLPGSPGVVAEPQPSTTPPPEDL